MKGGEEKMVKQEFNFNEADTLKTTLKNEIDKIKSDLGRMEKKVESVTNWWKGGSEEAFIGNFKHTKNSVVTGLEQWLSDYQTLIDSIKRNKEESDKFLADQLRI